ncbi:MAG: hypothetical protein K6F08_02025 [bacterium]|nr:hypothetical protein [bacterium]
MDLKQNGNLTNNNSGADDNAYVFVPKKKYSINNFLSSIKKHKMTENPEDEEFDNFSNGEDEEVINEENEEKVEPQQQEDRSAYARQLFEGKVWTSKRKTNENEQPEEVAEPVVNEQVGQEPEVGEQVNEELEEDVNDEDLDSYLNKLVARTEDENIPKVNSNQDFENYDEPSDNLESAEENVENAESAELDDAKLDEEIEKDAEIIANLDTSEPEQQPEQPEQPAEQEQVSEVANEENKQPEDEAEQVEQASEETGEKVDEENQEGQEGEEKKQRRSISKLDYFKYRFLNTSAVGAEGKQQVEELASRYGAKNNQNAGIIASESGASVEVHYNASFDKGDVNLDFSKKGSVKVYHDNKYLSILASILAILYAIVGVVVYFVVGPFTPEVIVAKSAHFNYYLKADNSNLIIQEYGKKLDLSGLYMIVNMSNGTTKTKAIDYSMITSISDNVNEDFIITKPGQIQITFFYEMPSSIIIYAYAVTKDDVKIKYKELDANKYLCWAEINIDVNKDGNVDISNKAFIDLDGETNTKTSVKYKVYRTESGEMVDYTFTPELVS